MDYQVKCDIVRVERYHPETGEITYQSHYGSLSFSYEFTESDQQLGSTIIFAYAIPYGYTDLLKDLKDAKNSFLNLPEAKYKASLDKFSISINHKEE